MKQLTFKYSFKEEETPTVPSFETWYSENTKERLLWRETPLSRKDAKQLYRTLKKNDFWGVNR